MLPRAPPSHLGHQGPCLFYGAGDGPREKIYICENASKVSLHEKKKKKRGDVPIQRVGRRENDMQKLSLARVFNEIYGRMEMLVNSCVRKLNSKKTRV